MKALAPAVFYDGAIALSTRKNYLGLIYNKPFRVKALRVAFALNTQRLLQVSLLWVPGGSTPADNTIPSGVDLLGGQTSNNFVVGDGLDGEYVIPIDREFPFGAVCISANNTDNANTHTLNARVELEDPSGE
jgi:hypothetical protein